jgi:NTP pyrophosphatase (non-canonical NTP hydrolase)
MTASFEQLIRDIQEWQAATFPNATPHSVIAHLTKELLELAADPLDGEEMADVLHLLIGLAALAKVDLRAALAAKFEKNKRRKWGEPDKYGIVEHVDEGTYRP